MAEAPKSAKPAAKPAPAKPAAAGPGVQKKPSPLMPVIALALILGGALWMTYSIMTAPEPVKDKKKSKGGGGH